VAATREHLAHRRFAIQNKQQKDQGARQKLSSVWGLGRHTPSKTLSPKRDTLKIRELRTDLRFLVPPLLKKLVQLLSVKSERQTKTSRKTSSTSASDILKSSSRRNYDNFRFVKNEKKATKRKGQINLGLQECDSRWTLLVLCACVESFQTSQ
jgi:hypothetical protein